MAKMRVTIRYSLDSDHKNRLRRFVEGRLNEIATTCGLPPVSTGTGTCEVIIDDLLWPRFGEELGAIFKHLYEQRDSPNAMLDHFWMHCDVIDKTPSPLASTLATEP